MTESGKKILASYLIRNGDTHKDAAEYLGISEKCFTKKMNNYEGAVFTLEEAKKLIKRYKISMKDAWLIFFADEIS